MKKMFSLMPILFAFVLLAAGFGTAILWRPTVFDAALGWNLSIVLTPALALLVQWKLAQERQISLVLTMTVVAIVNTCIVLGSRLGAWTGEDWWRALSGNGLPDLPGKTALGGLLLAVFAYLAIHRWWKLPRGLADVLVLSLPLAALTGRMGCLLAGCCYGIPTNADWGISYGPGTPAFQHQVASGHIPADAVSSTFLFPVQLFFIAGNLLIFTVLWQNRKKFYRPGAIALLGLGLLALQRFGFEFFREAATNRGGFGLMFWGIKMSQWAALLLGIASLTGFCRLQFFSDKTNLSTKKAKSVALSPSILSYALFVITLGSLLLSNIFTLDEALIILISCIPAVFLLGKQLRQEHLAGKRVATAAAMLSISAMVLMLNPIDTIWPGPSQWERWIDVRAGGSFGSHKEIIRDCDGNIIESNIIKTNSGGAEIGANWQKGETKLTLGLRGAFGKIHSDDSNSEENNYQYSSVGIQGGASYKWIGASLGFFSRRQKYPSLVGLNRAPETLIFPSGSLRLGRADLFSVDLRFFDEPVLGTLNEPPFSLGFFNWGFRDRTGNSLLRAGVAVTSVGEGTFALAGRFPLGKSGLNGSFAAYLSNANIFSVGLGYSFRGNRE